MTPEQFETIINNLERIVTINFKITNLAAAFDQNDQSHIGDELRRWHEELAEVFDNVKSTVVSIEVEKQKGKPKKTKAKTPDMKEVVVRLEEVGMQLADSEAKLISVINKFREG